MSVTKINYFFDALSALQERWDNLFSCKGLIAFRESYCKVRLPVALDLRYAPFIVKCTALPPGADNDLREMNLVVAFFVHDMNVVKRRDRNGGDKQVVFVNIVGAPYLPSKVATSTVRFYLAQQRDCEGGARLNYVSIR